MPRRAYKRPVEEGVIRDLEKNGYEVVRRGLPFCFAKKKGGGPMIAIYVRHAMRGKVININSDGFSKAQIRGMEFFETSGSQIVRVGG